MTVIHYNKPLYDMYIFSLPEGQDYETGDDENCSKQGEDEVTGSPPARVIEHFGRLQ